MYSSIYFVCDLLVDVTAGSHNAESSLVAVEASWREVSGDTSSDPAASSCTVSAVSASAIAVKRLPRTWSP